MSEKTKQIFVSDHDGTMTDADKEALYYDEIVLDYLSESLGIAESELDQMLAMAKSEIKSLPQKYGWVRNGFMVAPASADHYIFNNVATEMVLAKLRGESRYSKIPSLDQQNGFMNQFFQTTSAKLGELGGFYREGVENYINELSEAGDFVIVTNSSPETVLKKLTGLLGQKANALKVVGNAKKYDVDSDWLGVVPNGEVTLPGFPRGVYLQRRTYYETLSKLASGDINRIAICGDIAELDTLMVDYLGCRTALVEAKNTAPWELEYYGGGDGKRFHSNTLGDISDWFRNK